MCSRWDGADLILSVRIQPKASRDAVGEIVDGELKIRITAPPVDGKANTYLLKFLARQFGVAKSAIDLISGETGRSKRLRIHSTKQLPPVLQPSQPSPE